MPSGYTASALIWSGKTDGSGNFIAFTQRDRTVWTALRSVLTGGTATTYTSVSAASAIPINAQMISGVIGPEANSNGFIAIASDANGIAEQIFECPTVNTSPFDGFQAAGNFANLPIMTSQTLYYKLQSAAAHRISINNYTF